MKIIVASCLVLAFADVGFSQYEGCDVANKDLYILASEGAVDSLVNTDDSHSPNFATSFLPAEGSPPDDEDSYYNGMYSEWSCMYAPGRVSDQTAIDQKGSKWTHDSSTAWVEGVEGPGENEVLLINQLDLTKPVEIWAGYGKSFELHEANGRPKTVRVFVVSIRALQLSISSYISIVI